MPSSSSSEGGSEIGDGDGDGDGGGRRGGEFEGPSSSRQRSSNGVWPAPFIEALASQVAIDAARTFGRLAAGRAITNVFAVCSTWRAVSRSDILWENLTRQIWARDRIQRQTWREEYEYRHRTAYSFRIRRAVYTTLDFEAPDDDNNGGLSCLCLALSDLHLACGFNDGSVRLFDLSSRRHISTFHPHHHDLLGHFSRAVSGIVLSEAKLVFASMDGDVHVAVIDDGAPRRVHLGNVVNDGTLVDFTGCTRWWVGLYAGVPGRAFHVWDSETEELVFMGGSLTDPDAVMGWHLLTELNESVGRVRISSQESAVACTGLKAMAFDLRDDWLGLGEEEFERGLIVDSFDVSNEVFLVVDSRGVASVRRVDSFEEVCRFNLRGRAQGRVLGCMNGGYAFVCAGGVIRAWDAEDGEYLYNVREGIGEAIALIADERHVAACSSDSRIHLWDFGAR
ncbi:hypothetical protein HHK36_005796 [Tetracentron sinense]|uniref:Transcriptional regulator STERILE APETALA n=1 Tax=Tetracentron sinense TaxID=13715 RepID=A0A834ZW05_TETSI|nr:hypothetical protein HHK36_005796 [Tetracentron sinense]